MIFRTIINGRMTYVEKTKLGERKILPNYVPGRRVQVVRLPGGQAVIRDFRTYHYAFFFNRMINYRTCRSAALVKWKGKGQAHRFRDEHEAAGMARRKGWVVI